MHRWAAIGVLAATVCKAVGSIDRKARGPRPLAVPQMKAFALDTCRNAARQIIAICDDLQADTDG